MLVNVLNKFEVNITEKRDLNLTVEVPIQEFIDEFDGYEFESDEDLLESATNYLFDNSGDFKLYGDLKKNEELCDWSDYDKMEILNSEEVLSELKKTISLKPVPTCCDKAPWNSNYCPTCGKYLK
jgi:hypothetical protein